MASAASIDFHRCTVVNIRGESFQLKEKRQAGSVLPAEIQKEVKIKKKISLSLNLGGSVFVSSKALNEKVI